MRYRWHTGSIAWLIHRVSGVLLTLYIFVHLYVLSSLKDPARYVSIMKLMKNPFVILSEVGLLALVLAHALNGLRVTLLELGLPTGMQKGLFYGAFIVGCLLIIAGSIPILGGVF